MKDPWVAWYPGDYLSKTRHLTMAQHGAYSLLLWEYYINGPIPARAQQVLNICSAHDQHTKADVDFVLGEFFVLQGGKYHHQRADEELGKREDIRNKRVKAGKIRQQMLSTSSAHAEHMDTQSQSHIKPYSGKGGDSRNSSKGGVNGKAKRPPSQQDFNERDLRKLADARRKVDTKLGAIVGSGIVVTGEEYLDMVCEEAGVTHKRALELEKIRKES